MPVFAASGDAYNPAEIDPKEHITFGPQTRINSDGTFTFYIHSQLVSSPFKVSNSSVTLKSFSNLNNAQDQYISNQTCAYSVSMKKTGVWGSQLISLSCVTGTESSGSTNSASTSDKYELVITKTGSNGYYLDGRGSLTNFDGHA